MLTCSQPSGRYYSQRKVQELTFWLAIHHTVIFLLKNNLHPVNMFHLNFYSRKGLFFNLKRCFKDAINSSHGCIGLATFDIRFLSVIESNLIV